MVLDCAKKVAVDFQKIDIAKITNNSDTEDKDCQKKKNYKMVKDYSYVFLPRPRRFGKTTNRNIESYEAVEVKQ